MLKDTTIHTHTVYVGAVCAVEIFNNFFGMQVEYTRVMTGDAGLHERYSGIRPASDFIRLVLDPNATGLRTVSIAYIQVHFSIRGDQLLHRKAHG